MMFVTRYHDIFIKCLPLFSKVLLDCLDITFTNLLSVAIIRDVSNGGILEYGIIYVYWLLCMHRHRRQLSSYVRKFFWVGTLMHPSPFITRRVQKTSVLNFCRLQKNVLKKNKLRGYINIFMCYISTYFFNAGCEIAD